MRRELVIGAMAGAVGIVALDGVSYLDMAVRGRPASRLPERLVERIMESAGVDLDGDDETRRNRMSAIGALLGYAVGLGTGAVFGLVRPRCPGLPRVAAATAVGAGAMALSDVPLVLFGLTDPRTWGPADWVSDIVPHLAYGLATVAAYDAFSGRGQRPRRGPSAARGHEV